LETLPAFLIGMLIAWLPPLVIFACLVLRAGNPDDVESD